MSRIRTKTYFTVLPIVLTTALISTMLTFYESRAVLTRMTNQHLTYKAEQLRDYINSEWNVVVALELSEDPAYRAAQEDSFKSYAYSLLRSPSEVVFVFNQEGQLVYRIGGNAESLASILQKDRILPSTPEPGWFYQGIFGEERVGIAFDFQPFEWTITITELQSQYFSEIAKILRDHLFVLVGATVLALLLSTIYLRYILRPLEQFSFTIEEIITTGDLSIRTPVRTRDEIGSLSKRFNELVETVDTQRQNLRDANEAERKAHETTRRREAETLKLLGSVSDYNDLETGAHLGRIGEFTSLFYTLLGYSDDEVELYAASAPLHDIGKIAIPESILQKPGALSPEEWELIKTHTTLGHELLKNSESQYLSVGAEIALTHHEHWNGNGYPRGLRGTEIPMAGRIVSIVDVFDALTSERPYKEPWSNERTLEYILSQKGLQFDPKLVDLFQNNFSRFASIRRAETR